MVRGMVEAGRGAVALRPQVMRGEELAGGTDLL